MPKVLIADDDAACRFCLRLALQRLGLEVVEASDGPGALRLYDGERPHLVLLDAILPGADGLEVLQAIRSHTHLAPVIAISGGGHVRSEHCLHPMVRHGAAAVLPKPFNMDELAAAIAAVLPLPRREHP